VGGGVQTGSTRPLGHLLAYCTWPGGLCGWRIWWNEWQGKPRYSEKTCPDATLSTTNPTWPDPGMNPGRRGGKPATNRLSHGAAWFLAYSPYWKKNRSRLMKSPWYVCIPPQNFWTSLPNFMKLCIFIVPSKVIWTPYVINSSHQ
jgi:hypothetical protein